jgi:hypothetical protein
MEKTAEIISQSSTINLISKSISTTRTSLSNTSNTIGRIQKIIETKTKVRSDLFFKNQNLEKRRREASKRREYEDQIEASKVSTNIQSGLRVASSSNQGPLSRILSFLGYMGAGWILENLPTWIAMGREFIERMKRAGQIIYSIPQTMWRILQSFGTSLRFIGRDILNLDFTDSSGDIRNSFSELTDNMELLGTQIVDGFKMLLEPTGEVDIPSTGEQQPDAEFPEVPVPTPGGGTSGGGGRWKPLFDAIGAGEGNYTSMFPSENYPQLVNMTIEEVIQFQKQKIKDGRASAAVGKYQMLYPERYAAAAGLPLTAKFSPANQDKMAGAYIEKNRGGSDWLSGKITDEQFGYQLAKEFAGLKQPNGVGYYDKDGTNKATVDWSVTKAALQKVKSTPTAPPKPTVTPQRPTVPPKPISTGTMSLIPQTGSGGFIQGGSGSGGEDTYATHFHIDAKTANPTPEQLTNIREVSFQAVKAMFARGSWVHFGNIKRNVYGNVSDSELKSIIAAEQRAHGARSSAAVDIQEHNPKSKQTFPSQPGSATKFPFAVGEVYYRGGYGREAEIIGSGGITVSHGAAGSKASQVSPQLAKIPSEKQTIASKTQPKISSATQQQRFIAESVKPERMGQQFLFIDDRTSDQEYSSSGSGGSYVSGILDKIGEFDLLNNFMKQKLLLDFNYL